MKILNRETGTDIMKQSPRDGSVEFKGEVGGGIWTT